MQYLRLLILALVAGQASAQILPQLAHSAENGQSVAAYPRNVPILGNATTPTRDVSTYVQGGVGTISRSLTSSLPEIVSVKDYRAKGDGVTDDTTAINLAISSNPGKLIYVPPGAYIYNGGATLGNGTVLAGAGRNTTLFQTTSATANLFTVSGFGAGIRGVAFNSTSTRTAGAYVVLSGANSFFDDFNVTGDFLGVNVSGVGAAVTQGYFYQGAAGADRIRVSGGNSQVIDHVMMGAAGTQNANAGIHLTTSDSVMISNTAVITQGYNLLVDSASSMNASLKVSNSFFDFSNTNNVKFIASGTGNIVRSTISQSWIGDATRSDGVQIVNSGTGIVSGIHFVNDDLLNNFGAGLRTSGVMSDISVIGGAAAHNAYGLYFGTSLTGLNVSNALIGAGAGFSGQTNEAVHISRGVTDILVSGNNLVGNGSAIVDLTEPGIRKNIISNVGYNPIASTAIPVSASPFTWTNSTGSPVSLFVNGGTVSSVTLGGNTVLAATNGVLPVPNNGIVVVTYTVAPKMAYLGM